jgi:hypothetical protein
MVVEVAVVIAKLEWFTYVLVCVYLTWLVDENVFLLQEKLDDTLVPLARCGPERCGA